MTVFDLKCSNDHEFETWFPSSDAFDKQRKAKKVVCPICGDTKVDKALMAPSVSGTKKKGEKAVHLSSKAEEQVGKYMTALKEIPEEARKIHYGETEERSIHGEATDEEAAELVEEGVEVQKIPWVPTHDA